MSRRRAPRVLLTDADARWAPAASRGLAAAGYRVAAVARERPAATHWSRSCDERLFLPDPHRDADAYLEGLERLVRTRRYDALLPAAETSLRLVSEHRERLEPYVATGLPPHGVVMKALDKQDVLVEAEEAGIPAPESVVCRSAAEAVAAAETLGFPVMVKPPRSLRRHGERGWSGQPSLPARDARELARAVDEVGTPLLVQRYERGSRVVSFGGVAVDTGLIAVATSRYLRTWPPHAGSASFSQTFDPDPALVSAVEAFVGSVGWRGIFELELLERRDGTMAMIDLNPRLYGSVALAIASGANLPALWCDTMIPERAGRTEVLGATPITSRAGWRYRSEAGEAKNLLRCIRRRDLVGVARIAVPHLRVVHTIFAPSDPAPLLAYVIQTRRARVARVT
jgi:predicted ATP-grasp superfamily ATP-dependent carboligase